MGREEYSIRYNGSGRGRTGQKRKGSGGGEEQKIDGKGKEEKSIV